MLQIEIYNIDPIDDNDALADEKGKWKYKRIEELTVPSVPTNVKQWRQPFQPRDRYNRPVV